MPSDAAAPFTVSGDHDPASFHDGDLEALRPTWGAEVECLFDYWYTLRKGNRFPSRLDIDPLDIVRILPHVFLGDIDPVGPEYIYRLAGEDIVTVFNHYNGRAGFAGVKLGESLPPNKAELIRNRWRPLAERGSIIYMRGLVYLTLDRFAIGERLVLPLSTQGDGVDGFWGLTVCEWHNSNMAPSSERLKIFYIDPTTAHPTQ